MSGLVITLLLAGLTIFFIWRGNRSAESPVARLLREAHSAFDVGDFPKSRRGYQQAATLCRAERATEDDREWLATALNGLGYVEYEEDRFDAARESFQQSIAASGEQHAIVEVSSRAMLVRIAAQPGGLSGDVDSLLTSLAGTVESLPAEQALEAIHFLSYFAAPLLQDDLITLVESVATLTIDTLDRLPENLQRSELAVDILNVAAGIRMVSACYEEAAELTERTMAIVEEGSTQLAQTIECLRNASFIAAIRGDVSAAEERARHALACAEAAPATPYTVALVRMQLAYVTSLKGEFEESLDHQSRAVDLLDRFCDDPAELVRGLAYLASQFRSLARYGEVFATLDRAEQLVVEADPPQWIQRDFHTLRGLCLFDTWQYDEARQDFEEALSIGTNLFGALHEETARVRLVQIALDLETGQLSSPSSAHAEVTGILETERGRSFRGEALAVLSDLSLQLGELTAAESQAREAVEIYEEQCAGRSQSAALAGETLGRVLEAAGKTDEARQCFETAVEKRESVPGGERCPYTARLLESLSRVTSARGYADRAASMRDRALEIRNRVAGLD